jgi:hypothetical protein
MPGEPDFLDAKDLRRLRPWTFRAGLGLATDDVKTLTNRLKRKDAEKKGKERGSKAQTQESAMDRWIKTDVLIVDESKCLRVRLNGKPRGLLTGCAVSMIDGRFWDKLEAVARNIRNINKPFGGIQLVLCGE